MHKLSELLGELPKNCIFDLYFTQQMRDLQILLACNHTESQNESTWNIFTVIFPQHEEVINTQGHAC